MNYFILILLSTLTFSAYGQVPVPVHGYIYCDDKAFLAQDAWRLETFNLSIEQNNLIIQSEFIYVNCVSAGSVYQPENTYFQIPKEDLQSYDANKRKVLMFLGYDPNVQEKELTRVIYTPITTSIATGVQKHFINEARNLKVVLGRDYNSYAAGNEVVKTFIIGVGHPQVSGPNKKFKPDIKNYGVSWGLLGGKALSLKFKQGTVSIESLKRVL